MKDELKKVTGIKGSTKPPPSSSSSSDHTDRDGVTWGSTEGRISARIAKNYNDSAIHTAVMEIDCRRLQDLINSGLSIQHRSIDGASPLHRAAEIGTIACAKILIENQAELEALNNMGQTAFHVAALNNQVELGHFLRSRGASVSCEQGCTKCRWLNQMIYRRLQKQRLMDYEISHQQSTKTEESPSTSEAKKKRHKKPKKRTDSSESVDLCAELAKCRLEMKGPYLDKELNRNLRQSQRKARQLAEVEDRELAPPQSPPVIVKAKAKVIPVPPSKSKSKVENFEEEKKGSPGGGGVSF